MKSKTLNPSKITKNQETQTEISKRKVDLSTYGHQLKNMKTFTTIVKRKRKVMKHTNRDTLSKNLGTDSSYIPSRHESFNIKPVITIQPMDQKKSSQKKLEVQDKLEVNSRYR